MERKMARSGEPPNPLDVHIGRRVRVRRQSCGLSQAALADAIGVSFQQVQKYERGANRISASMLYRIASTLRAPAGHFFGGLPDPAAADGAPDRATDILFALPEGRDLAVAFVALKPSMRAALVSLARAMAEGADGGLSVAPPSLSPPSR